MKNQTKKETVFVKLLGIESALYSVQDIDLLFDKILKSARIFFCADAGVIYLEKDQNLLLKFYQNGSLEKDLSKGDKLRFPFSRVPIDMNSIAGYVFLSKKLVNEQNMDFLSSSKPYSKDRFTEYKDYNVVSSLTIPLTSQTGVSWGVLQLFNKLDLNGNIVSFSNSDEAYLKHFICSASIAIEKGQITRSFVERMLKIVQVKDTRECLAHINRVADYSLEIYDRFAMSRNISKIEYERFRDALHIASMLHDVGKYAIPASLLQKTGKLTEDEFNVVKAHTWFGAKLFFPFNSFVDSIAYEVTFHHHENWDGTGYPGNVDMNVRSLLNSEINGYANGLKGNDIPLSARIVSIADVYDVLSSSRTYKEAWKEEAVLDEINRCKGTKFDPELVDCFFDALPSIKAIKTRYRD